MDKRESHFIVDTLNIVHKRSEKESSWVDFAKDVKQVLDSRFGREWNVLIGKSMGYAMKTKKKASVVASTPGGETVVCWKSPGFEVEDANIVRIKATLSVSEEDKLMIDSRQQDKSSRLNLIRVPHGSHTNILTLIENLLDDMKSTADHQDSARAIRAHLTARFGTVWHVVVGETKGFQMEPARGSTDHYIMCTKKSGVKIEFYRHKQETPAGLSSMKSMFGLPSLSTVMEILPKIMFVFLCLAFMVQRSSVCLSDTPHFACRIAHSVPLAPLAGFLLVATVVKEVRKRVNRRSASKAKKLQ